VFEDGKSTYTGKGVDAGPPAVVELVLPPHPTNAPHDSKIKAKS
jgi:hypothetical protein